MCRLSVPRSRALFIFNRFRPFGSRVKKRYHCPTHRRTNLSRGCCRRGAKNYWLVRCLSSERWASPNIASVAAVTWPACSALLRCPPNICFSRPLPGCLINLHWGLPTRPEEAVSSRVHACPYHANGTVAWNQSQSITTLSHTGVYFWNQYDNIRFWRCPEWPPRHPCFARIRKRRFTNDGTILYPLHFSTTTFHFSYTLESRVSPTITNDRIE